MLEDRDYMKAGSGRTRGWKILQPRTLVLPLVAFTVSVYVLQLLTKNFSSLGFGLPVLDSFPAVASPGATVEWAFGLVAYMFIHGGDPWHAITNMVLLFFIGRRVERVMKPWRLLFFYLVAGVLAGGFWLAFNWRGPTRGVVGASGAVFAVALAALMLIPNKEVMFCWVFPIRMKWVIAGFALLQLVSFLSTMGRDNISHLAHIGGVIGGYLLLRAFFRRHIVLDISSIWRPRRKRGGKRQGRPDASWTVHPPPQKSEGKDDGVDPLTQIDPILDKIGKQGMKSLTRDERRILDRAREHLNRGG